MDGAPCSFFFSSRKVEHRRNNYDCNRINKSTPLHRVLLLYLMKPVIVSFFNRSFCREILYTYSDDRRRYGQALGEGLTWVKLVSTLLIFSGVYLVNFGLKKKPTS